MRQISVYRRIGFLWFEGLTALSLVGSRDAFAPTSAGTKACGHVAVVLRRRTLATRRPTIMRLFAVSGCLALGACSPSSHELASLAGHGAVQGDAPIKASSTIVIEAPRERVWRILVNVSRWPRWQPDISGVSGADTLAGGTAFTWHTGGTTIHSRVALFSPPSAVAWTGRAATARAIHVFVLTALGPNRTKVESRESMSGFLISWFYDAAALQKSEDTMLKNLANAAKAGQG